MYQSAKQGFRASREIPFERLMKDYYAIRGWDSNGVPSEQTLKKLDLDLAGAK
jgi:aldehyde:ferredoxin oxidoreductase